MRSCERPSKSSASDFVPPSVSKLYSFSTGPQGSSRRFSASASLRRVSSSSSFSSSSRAACHSSLVPTLCSVIGLPPVSVGLFLIAGRRLGNALDRRQALVPIRGDPCHRSRSGDELLGADHIADLAPSPPALDEARAVK